MEKLVGCCGFKCYSCAAFEKNIHNEEERKKVCAKWKYYFDYEISSENMHCTGCNAVTGGNSEMIHPQCPYFTCAIQKGLSSCNDCCDYPCEKLNQYFSAYKETYMNLKNKIMPEDEEGYFLTYIVNSKNTN